jgi:hypothetical protein
MLVEEALDEEEEEAERMAEELLKVRRKTVAEIVEFCARLCCGKSFLCSKLNKR